ncbi:MAG: hypothetical protein AAB493_02765 [Patescibacteria group bacterium]
MEIKNKKTIINLYKYTIFVVFILFFISAIDTMAGISVNLLTENATNITNTGATLRGTLNPGGFANVYFRYSPLEKPPVFCNDIYGSRMRATDEIPISGNVKKEVSFNVVNLSPYTKYYYCIVGSNDSGIAYGGVKFFQTLLTSGISVTTKNALVVDSASAYLNGTYSATMPTETYFRLKKDGAEWQNQKFGLQQHSSGTGGSISYLLKELSPNTSYQFKAVISSKTSDEAIDGATLTFNTKSVGKIGPGTGTGGVGYESSCTNIDSDINCNGTSGLSIEIGMETGITETETAETSTENPSNLVLGQTATPPADAIVRYHEGIETVFTRQIMANTELARTYGYQDGVDLQTFAWNLSDLLARTFGYVNSRGKEIRVSKPDIAAYQLYVVNGILTVYEYYDSKIVNIQKITDVLRNKYYYEYYFQK